ncbi:MAG: hypothetical protein FWH27_00045 [Planctomycetaceae bacterium]|nr:hypothetical protein [Planctomycetaceae bacterium]
MAMAEQTDQEYRLKVKLFGRIERTHNLSLLRKVESLLDEQLPENVYLLSAEEREGMNLARQQLDAGLGIPHEIVEGELNRWLDELERNECETNGN